MIAHVAFDSSRTAVVERRQNSVASPSGARSVTLARVPEPTDGLRGGAFVEAYDRMQESLRAAGELETSDLLRCGVREGLALEVGAGPGYLGLDWLERTSDTRLVALDVSPEMAARAGRNARIRGLHARSLQVVGSVHDVPYPDATFEAVFSSRSLHEWADPVAAFDEMWRVLRAGGRLWVSDLRRDIPARARRFLEVRVSDDLMREGLGTSIAASYTVTELEQLLGASKLQNIDIRETPLGLRLFAMKGKQGS